MKAPEDSVSGQIDKSVSPESGETRSSEISELENKEIKAPMASVPKFPWTQAIQVMSPDHPMVNWAPKIGDRITLHLHRDCFALIWPRL